MHSYVKCAMQFILVLGILFQRVFCSLAQDGNRFNETKPEAFQNNFLGFSNFTNIYSIPFTTEAPNDFSRDAPIDITTETPTSDSTHTPLTTRAPKEFRTEPPEIDMDRLKFIDKLLAKYDKRVWPTFGTNSPTEVTVNIYINSLGSVSAANMDFGMDIYLRQSWVDPRLQFRQFGLNETMTLNGQDIIDRIWKPDLFFRNLKSGHFHTLTVPNKLVKLSPNDIQRCLIILGSYAQTVDQVIFKWRAASPITIEKEIEVPEFHVIPQDPGTFWRDIDTGVFSFLNVSFVFMRQNGYHLVQTYLPTFLIVMMSWISFWVPVEAAPARVTLGVTTLLSLTTVASGIRSQLPPVSYAKAIDIWIGACSVMVFAALLEFAFASYISRMKVRHDDGKKCIIFGKQRRNDGHIETKCQAVLPPCPESDQKIQMRRSHTVDRWSRILFPFVFLAFNMFYWIYYLSQRAQMEQLYL